MREVERAAHTLKGSLIQFCATSAATWAAKLEDSARRGDHPEAGRQLDQLRSEVRRFELDLRRAVQTHQGSGAFPVAAQTRFT
jgi:HPt (histidine-containing phosphotransfer) domain-containing protein